MINARYKQYVLALLLVSPLSVGQEWNGTVLGFDASPAPMLGDMLGIRNILNDNGFTYNLGYLNEIGWNAGGATIKTRMWLISISLR